MCMRKWKIRIRLSYSHREALFSKNYKLSFSCSSKKGNEFQTSTLENAIVAISWNFKLVWALKLLTKNFLQPIDKKTFTLPNVDSAKSNSPVPVLGYQFQVHSPSQYWSERTTSNHIFFSWQNSNLGTKLKLRGRRQNTWKIEAF